MEILRTESINLELVADLCSFEKHKEQPTIRDRSKWHVSNLIESSKSISRGDNTYHEYEGEPSGIMSMGRIWESAVDCYLFDYAAQRDGFYSPNIEQIKDDILGSLDGMMYLPGVGTPVCETKLRFTQSSEILGKHLQQIRAYCHLLDTDLACYISGHISSNPPTARAEMRIIRFTKQSIQENWEMLVHTKNWLIECGCSPNGGTK
jgi:hypothetical protein